MKEPIRVLIIEDSALMRRELTKIINSDDNLVVVGAAVDAEDGLEMIRKLDPEVVTIDVNLPGMDGIACLQHIMIENPRPCVMISAYTKKDSIETFEALELGAVDFVEKPSGEISRDIIGLKDKITTKIRQAALANISTLTRMDAGTPEPEARPRQMKTESGPPDKIVVIGVSTGGPRTLMTIIPKLPPDLDAPVLVIQHMPRKFTGSFAKRLDQYSQILVKEAVHGEPLINGTVYVAPGNRNLTLLAGNEGAVIEIANPSKGDIFVPSVNKSLNCSIDIFGRRTIGVILTGMGDDGAAAMERLYSMGGETIAESDETAVIFGMPQAVISRGWVRNIAPAHKIANKIQGALKNVARQR